MNCEICGKEIEKSQYSGCMICSGKCFHIKYWRDIVSEKDKHIIVNGKCYYDAGEVERPSSYSFLGCSGRRFWIQFKDGHKITTNNLWVQGEIPKEFREQLPDNAEFYCPEYIKYANSLMKSQF